MTTTLTFADLDHIFDSAGYRAARDLAYPLAAYEPKFAVSLADDVLHQRGFTEQQVAEVTRNGEALWSFLKHLVDGYGPRLMAISKLPASTSVTTRELPMQIINALGLLPEGPCLYAIRELATGSPGAVHSATLDFKYKLFYLFQYSDLEDGGAVSVAERMQGVIDKLLPSITVEANGTTHMNMAKFLEEIFEHGKASIHDTAILESLPKLTAEDYADPARVSTWLKSVNASLAIVESERTVRLEGLPSLFEQNVVKGRFVLDTLDAYAASKGKDLRFNRPYGGTSHLNVYAHQAGFQNDHRTVSEVTMTMDTVKKYNSPFSAITPTPTPAL